MFKIRRRALLLLLAPGIAGAQDKVTYQDHVRPILENRCLNCHNAEKKKGGLDLSTFGATMAGGSGGVNLEPGDAGNSQFFKVITHAAEPFMPPKSDKIPQAEMDVISKWIAGGLLETASSSAKVKKKADFAMAAGGNAGKPDGPPAMPEHLLLEPVVVAPRADAVTAMAHSPWAPLMAVGSTKQVLLYHSETKELVGVLPFPEGGFPECVSFTRNGALVLASGGTGGKKGVVAVWDVKTGKRVITLGEEFESIGAADITPDYKRIAIGTRERRVKIYDTATGRKLSEIKKHTDWVTSVAFSPDGVLLATGDRNGGAYVWETATGGEFYNLKGHEKRVASIAWRSDSNLVATGSEDGNWIWWEMVNGSQVKKQGAHGGVLTLGFANDGRMVSGGRDGHVRIWDSSGKQVRDWVAGGGMVLSARFTQEGKTVITGTSAGDIRIWDAAKDSPALGFVLYNPPTIETRVEQAGKDIAVKQSEAEKAKAAAAEKEKLTADAKAEIEATRKAMAEAEATAAAKAKEAEALKGEIAGLEKNLKDAQAGAEAAKKQLAEDKALDAQARAALEAKLKTLTGDVTRVEADLATRRQTVPQREQEAAALRAKKEDLAKSMPDREKKAAEMEKALAAAKPAADTAAAAIEGSRRSLQYWQAAKENREVLTLRTDLAALKEKVEDLKAEIPSIEGEIKALSAQQSATPPPKPEELPKIQKKLDLANKRLAEARKELATSEPQVPEKEKAVEATWQKYLSMLPK